MQTFRYMFPHLKWVQKEEYDLEDTSIKIGSKIMYRHNDCVQYGEVQAIDQDCKHVTVARFNFTQKERKLGCLLFTCTMPPGPIFRVHVNDYLGHFIVTNGYVNKYVSLQLIKK